MLSGELVSEPFSPPVEARFVGARGLLAHDVDLFLFKSGQGICFMSFRAGYIEMMQ